MAAAVRCQSGSSPTFIGCAFSQNNAVGATEPDGGAVAIWDGGHPEFFSCTFTENQAYWDGAVLNFSGVTMHDCRFQGNTANGAAGGAYGQYGDPFGGGSSELVNCSFFGNSAIGNTGGAVVVQLPGASATITYCLFADNRTNTNNGSALFVGNEAVAAVTNCTFTGNTANAEGGALRVNTAIASVDNCVLWDNLPTEISVFNAVPSISHSDIEGGWAGDGNIDEDPLFVDPDGPDDDPNTWEDNDYHLAAGSPCIDAADNMAVPMDLTTDLDGNPRFIDDSTTADCAQAPGECGECPVVDMGAYEFPDGTIECCPADLDGDGAVGAFDLALLLGSWGPYAPCPPFDAADFNEDCGVNAADLAQLLGAWGPCE